MIFSCNIVKTRVIDVEAIERIVADLSSNEDDVAHEIFQVSLDFKSLSLFKHRFINYLRKVVDAFSTPYLRYDEKSKTFKWLSNPPRDIFDDVEARSGMFRERLLIIQQRLLRSDLFTLKGIRNTSNNSSNKGNRKAEEV
jgi:hypothetical protein